MPIKKYESNYDEESLVLHIDGKDTRIEFKGGGRYPFKHGGVYITENPKIQNALEARRDYGRRFRVVDSYMTRSEQEKQNREVLDDLAKLPTKKAEPQEPIRKIVESSIKTVDEVKNAIEARDYILKNFPGTVFKEVQSKTLILDFAKTHNVTFPNWK